MQHMVIQMPRMQQSSRLGTTLFEAAKQIRGDESRSSYTCRICTSSSTYVVVVDTTGGSVEYRPGNFARLHFHA